MLVMVLTVVSKCNKYIKVHIEEGSRTIMAEIPLYL